MDAGLHAKNVKKSYGATQALRGVDIEVAPGEIVAVIGPSGSGKTTLLHSLAAITNIDSGEIVFDGKHIAGLSDNARSRLRRQQFGFVFQFGQLVPELTALDNIALPLLLNRVSRKAAYQEAGQWIKKVNLIPQSDSLAGELSGGQMQRVAIARAMIIKPRVLFADEPTGSLDSVNSKMILDLLTRTARQQNTTIIMVTHEPSIAAYADRTITMRDGLVAESSA
ncbi:macrolide ABC transporter ATP-binding protein [Candidatus Saccharibacteria bacterium]|nr:MAG: macrolide ABC transporter ATP-binding protein [Candidatus Saccharibacteria bacterium]